MFKRSVDRVISASLQARRVNDVRRIYGLQSIVGSANRDQPMRSSLAPHNISFISPVLSQQRGIYYGNVTNQDEVGYNAPNNRQKQEKLKKEQEQQEHMFRAQKTSVNGQAAQRGSQDARQNEFQSSTRFPRASRPNSRNDGAFESSETSTASTASATSSPFGAGRQNVPDAVSTPGISYGNNERDGRAEDYSALSRGSKESSKATPASSYGSSSSPASAASNRSSSRAPYMQNASSNAEFEGKINRAGGDLKGSSSFSRESKGFGSNASSPSMSGSYQSASKASSSTASRDANPTSNNAYYTYSPGYRPPGASPARSTASTGTALARSSSYILDDDEGGIQSAKTGSNNGELEINPVTGHNMKPMQHRAGRESETQSMNMARKTNAQQRDGTLLTKQGAQSYQALYNENLQKNEKGRFEGNSREQGDYNRNFTKQHSTSGTSRMDSSSEASPMAQFQHLKDAAASKVQSQASSIAGKIERKVEEVGEKIMSAVDAPTTQKILSSEPVKRAESALRSAANEVVSEVADKASTVASKLGLTGESNSYRASHQSNTESPLQQVGKVGQAMVSALGEAISSATNATNTTPASSRASKPSVESPEKEDRYAGVYPASESARHGRQFSNVRAEEIDTRNPGSSAVFGSNRGASTSSPSSSYASAPSASTMSYDRRDQSRYETENARNTRDEKSSEEYDTYRPYDPKEFKEKERGYDRMSTNSSRGTSDQYEGFASSIRAGLASAASLVARAAQTVSNSLHPETGKEHSEHYNMRVASSSDPSSRSREGFDARSASDASRSGQNPRSSTTMSSSSSSSSIPSYGPSGTSSTASTASAEFSRGRSQDSTDSRASPASHTSNASPIYVHHIKPQTDIHQSASTQSTRDASRNQGSSQNLHQAPRSQSNMQPQGRDSHEKGQNMSHRPSQEAQFQNQSGHEEYRHYERPNEAHTQHAKPHAIYSEYELTSQDLQRAQRVGDYGTIRAHDETLRFVSRDMDKHVNGDATSREQRGSRVMGSAAHTQAARPTSSDSPQPTSTTQSASTPYEQIHRSSSTSTSSNSLKGENSHLFSGVEAHVASGSSRVSRSTDSTPKPTSTHTHSSHSSKSTVSNVHKGPFGVPKQVTQDPKAHTTVATPSYSGVAVTSSRGSLQYAGTRDGPGTKVEASPPIHPRPSMANAKEGTSSASTSSTNLSSSYQGRDDKSKAQTIQSESGMSSIKHEDSPEVLRAYQRYPNVRSGDVENAIKMASKQAMQRVSKAYEHMQQQEESKTGSGVGATGKTTLSGSRDTPSLSSSSVSIADFAGDYPVPLQGSVLGDHVGPRGTGLSGKPRVNALYSGATDSDGGVVYMRNRTTGALYKVIDDENEIDDDLQNVFARDNRTDRDDDSTFRGRSASQTSQNTRNPRDHNGNKATFSTTSTHSRIPPVRESFSSLSRDDEDGQEYTHRLDTNSLREESGSPPKTIHGNVHEEAAQYDKTGNVQSREGNEEPRQTTMNAQGKPVLIHHNYNSAVDSKLDENRYNTTFVINGRKEKDIKSKQDDVTMHQKQKNIKLDKHGSVPQKQEVNTGTGSASNQASNQASNSAYIPPEYQAVS